MNENAASSRVKQKGFIPESFESWFSSAPAFFRQISLPSSTQIFHQEKHRNLNWQPCNIWSNFAWLKWNDSDYILQPAGLNKPVWSPDPNALSSREETGSERKNKQFAVLFQQAPRQGYAAWRVGVIISFVISLN